MLGNMTQLDMEGEQRMQKYMEEMKFLYGELYNHDEQAFSYFCEMLRGQYAARKPELKEWDLEKLKNTEWYDNCDNLGIQMYANAFAGSLKGVNQRLDYLSDLGVSVLHIHPAMEEMGEIRNGEFIFALPAESEETHGTFEDLTDLAKSCRNENMTLCVDFPLNHTLSDHDWARKAAAGDKEYQNRYYFYDSWEIPMENEKTIPQELPEICPGNYSWCSEAGKVVMTTFRQNEWDLNYHNPTVFNDMTQWLLELAGSGVQAIRLEDIEFLWKELGTSCRNLPQIHSLLRLWRIAVDIVCPGVLLMGDAGNEEPLNIPYSGTADRPECHILYNKPMMPVYWHSVATRDVRLLKHCLGKSFAHPDKIVYMNFLRDHDEVRWNLDYGFLQTLGEEQTPHRKFLCDYFTGKYYGSDARGELYNDDPRFNDARVCGTTASLCGLEAAEYEQNENKTTNALDLDIMLHALIITLNGIPAISSGDEIGQLNDYGYHRNRKKAFDARYLQRGYFDEEDAEKRYDTETVQGILYGAMKSLKNIRVSHSIFDSRADEWIMEPWNDHILALGRYYNGEKLISLFNFSEFEQTAWIDESDEYYDLITGQKKPVKAIQLPAYGFLWLMKA